MNVIEVTDKKTFLKVLPLLNQLLVEEGEKTVLKELAWEGFEKGAKTGYRQFYTMIENNISGVIGIREFYDPLLGNGLGFEINNLVVLPKHRGQGIGTELLKFT